VAILLPQNPYEVSLAIYSATQIQKWLDDANKAAALKEDVSEYKSSGVVYIYSHDNITNEQAKKEIDKTFTPLGYTLRYRNQDYLELIRYQVESHRRPMPPMYEWVKDIPSLIPGQNVKPPDWAVTGIIGQPDSFLPLPAPPMLPQGK
jgi:hypothetical protein